MLSVLNGIASEEVLAQAYGREKVVWCVAQKMSAVKVGNQATISPFGDLALGVPAEMDPSRLQRLTALLDSIHFPYELPGDIRRHMWSKLMVNTGCNQTAMVFECGYGGLMEPKAKEVMTGAMREVLLVARAEGISLREEDLQGWVKVIESFPPDGEPSMQPGRQGPPQKRGRAVLRHHPPSWHAARHSNARQRLAVSTDSGNGGGLLKRSGTNVSSR